MGPRCTLCPPLYLLHRSLRLGPCPLLSAQDLTLSLCLSVCLSVWAPQQGRRKPHPPSYGLCLHHSPGQRWAPRWRRQPQRPFWAEMKSALLELYSLALIWFSRVSRASSLMNQALQELGGRQAAGWTPTWGDLPAASSGGWTGAKAL